MLQLGSRAMKKSDFCSRKETIQHGFSLLEILVSLSVGLIILVAIGVAYQNSSNLSRQSENQSELNEPAKIVMRMLQREVSMAGFVDVFDLGSGSQTQAAALFVPGNSGLVNLYARVPEATILATPLGQFFPGLLPVFGCDGAMSSTPNDLVRASTAVTLACGALSTITHSLQLAYQASPAGGTNTLVSLLPNNADTGEGFDCLQQAAPAAATSPRNKFVINRYFVGANNGVNELFCAGSGDATARPIARGVEEFVIRYQLAQPGVAAGTGTSVIAAGGSQSQYVDATFVSDFTKNPLGWANVTAVEICIVSATAATGAAAAGTVESQPRRPTCTRTAGGAFNTDVARAAGDSRLWKRYTSIVSVRNSVFSTPF